mmetsp:Transcript_23804/g.35543  ORF Transcript_23804/g.35543 Transcript_23804/m.35543 type:complete len:207 (-) Transcript_23804:558-1178(-)
MQQCVETGSNVDEGSDNDLHFLDAQSRTSSSSYMNDIESGIEQVTVATSASASQALHERNDHVTTNNNQPSILAQSLASGLGFVVGYSVLGVGTGLIVSLAVLGSYLEDNSTNNSDTRASPLEVGGNSAAAAEECKNTAAPANTSSHQTLADALTFGSAGRDCCYCDCSKCILVKIWSRVLSFLRCFLCWTFCGCVMCISICCEDD